MPADLRRHNAAQHHPQIAQQIDASLVVIDDAQVPANRTRLHALRLRTRLHSGSDAPARARSWPTGDHSVACAALATRPGGCVESHHSAT